MRIRFTGWFGAGFIGPWAFALTFPLTQWAEVSQAVAITAGIMLGFAGLGLLGFPMKANADPRAVAAAALGMLAHAGLFGGWLP